MPAPARLLVATRSAHKLREIREILRPARTLELIDLDDAGVAPLPDEDAIEAFDSFRENALAKARYFAQRARLPTLADDSGIVVHALGGEPGVRSRRFAARTDLSGLALDDANNALLLERLQRVPDRARTAHYVCAAALALPNGPNATAIGTCSGQILHAPAGTAGFGYDPLFFMPEIGVTFAQLDAHAKHRYSHRARALRALLAILGDTL
jgi:XTP/dITP diphosphohydrolase